MRLKLTNGEAGALKAMARYVLESPALEYLETLTPAQQRVHERALRQLTEALDVRYDACAFCGGGFGIPGADRRTHRRKYCSTACKVASFRLRQRSSKA